MKTILTIILVIIIAGVAFWLLPAAIGIIIAVFKFQSGNITGGIIAVVVGLLLEALWLFLMSNGVPAESGGSVDEECPYCGSGDTDGNHCYTCDDDF